MASDYTKGLSSCIPALVQIRAHAVRVRAVSARQACEREIRRIADELIIDAGIMQTARDLAEFNERIEA